MRIGIDARFYGSVGKGLGRYTEKLIANLEKQDHVNDYLIFLRRENWHEYQPGNSNFKKILADIPWYGFREQLILPFILKKFDLDLMHFTHFNVPLFYTGKFVVTIHDLILFHYPTKKATALSPLFYAFKRLAHRIVISHAINKSRYILAVSEHTKNDILNFFKIPVDKICVTHEGVDQEQFCSHEPKSEILQKYGIMKPYALYVGNAYPHKNLERLILAIKEIAKTHPLLKLVMVGKKDYFYERLEKFAANNSALNIFFAGYVPDRELAAIYQEAAVYVFPSLYEGFGLPPLEAMSQGTPVISSNASCLPEILGEAAVYFNPKGIIEMADKIRGVLEDKQLQEKLARKGKDLIKRYSWTELAQKTLAIYRKCALLRNIKE